MALLLAVFQKLRLVREKNQLTLEVAKYSSGLDRIQKNIERTQKRYTSLFQQLESQAKSMQNNASMYFRSMAGFGTDSVNPWSLGGMNGYIYQNMLDIAVKNGLSQETAEAMRDEYMTNGKFLTKEDPDNAGKYIYENYTEDDVKIFMQAMNAARMMQDQARMGVQQASQQYSDNVSIWLEAQKEQLQAEQDAALDALSYQETMMELDKTQRETRLTRINQEIQSYDQLISNEAQNAAPKFGLG